VKFSPHTFKTDFPYKVKRLKVSAKKLYTAIQLTSRSTHYWQTGSTLGNSSTSPSFTEQKVHYRVHKSPQPIYFLSHNDSVHTPEIHFLRATLILDPYAEVFKVMPCADGCLSPGLKRREHSCDESPPWRWRQYRPLKRRWTHTTLHGATHQKTAIFVLAAVRNSNPNWYLPVRLSNKVLCSYLINMQANPIFLISYHYLVRSKFMTLGIKRGFLQTPITSPLGPNIIHGAPFWTTSIGVLLMWQTKFRIHIKQAKL
jgi:hypothetical protein